MNPRLRNTVGLGLLIVSVVILARFGAWKAGTLTSAMGRLLEFSRLLLPPRWDVVPALTASMFETIQIAFAGTMLGWVFALPMALLGTRTLFGPASSGFARGVIGALRSIPSILLGVVAVVAFGLGPLAGVFGVALYTVGYLGKLYYEAFESVDTEVLEAVKSVGTTRLQLWRHAVLPEAMPAVISQLLFMFEYNIRASAILGFVGAGGIGYYMLGYVQMLQYRPLTTAILLTFLVVMLVDRLSLWLRQRLLPDWTAAR